MKRYPSIKCTKREYDTEKKRQLKELNIVLARLMSGCAIIEIWGTTKFTNSISKIQSEITKIQEVLKNA